MKNLRMLLVCIMLITSYIMIVFPVDTVKANLTTGLVGYWNFDEGIGNIAHDSSGHNLNGVIINALWTTGYSGYGLDFNGENSNINLNNYSTTLGFGKVDDYKISAWIKSESNQSGIIYMITYTFPMPIFYIKFKSDGTLQMKVQSTDICGLLINSTDSYNDGLWHYIEGRYYGNITNPTMELYVDYQLVGNDSDWLCPMASFQFKLAKIGMSTNESEFFDGIIDEVKVFKIIGGNKPPSIPTCIYDKKNNELLVNSTDPNGDQIRYGVSWNNNQNVDKWTEFFDSGAIVTIECDRKKGPIGVIAEDTNSALSGWVSVTVKSKSIITSLFLQRFVECFPFFKKIFY